MSRNPSISRSVSSRRLETGTTTRTTCINPLSASSSALISCRVSQIGVSSARPWAVSNASSRPRTPCNTRPRTRTQSSLSIWLAALVHRSDQCEPVEWPCSRLLPASSRPPRFQVAYSNSARGFNDRDAFAHCLPLLVPPQLRRPSSPYSSAQLPHPACPL